jgi:hypothetical protein
MSANTPLQLANALRSYPHFCGETCPLCNAAAELERARGAVTPGDLIKATSSGMAIIFTHVGPYTTLTPYMKGKWDELSALHAKANKALTASPPGGFSDFIRNASPEEKERVYQGVMERAAERQKAVEAGVEPSSAAGVEEPHYYVEVDEGVARIGQRTEQFGTVYVRLADYDKLAARLREMGERGDYWFDLYQREGADHLNDIQRLEQLERDREALRKALLLLQPGLELDLRYADPDDDIDALRLRVQTVRAALSAREGGKDVR